MIYLLDTNAWSKYLNKRPSPVKERVREAGFDALRVSAVVMAELLYGAHHGPSPGANLALLERVFSTVAPIGFDAGAARQAGRIRADLASRGPPSPTG